MVLYSMKDLADKIKRYFIFSREEVKDLIVTIFFLAFFVSFREWGVDKFELSTGLWNLFNSMIIVTLAVLVNNSVQRISALQVGIRVEYRIWWYGIIIGLILVFASNGSLWFLAAGGIVFHHLAAHRLGFFRYGLNQKVMGVVSFLGPLSNVGLAVIFKILLLIFPTNILIKKAIIVNLWYAIFNMLPIPPLPGLNTMFFSRVVYFLVFGSIIGITFLLMLNVNIVLAILGAFFVGVLFMLYAFKVFEGAF